MSNTNKFNTNLDYKTVRLFLLLRLRTAKKIKRMFKYTQETDPQFWQHCLGAELEALNCYYNFLESVHYNQRIPVLKTKNGLEEAKRIIKEGSQTYEEFCASKW